MKTQILYNTETDMETAAEIIDRGGLVAFPTETVYGLGADALNADAVARVYQAKGRPSDNPMIVHIATRSALSEITEEITPAMNILMDSFWPGPMTLVVKKRDIVPYRTTGGLETVAVRMPDNNIALDLILRSGKPIAAPSANISGKPSPTTAQHVIDDLSGKIDAVIAGDDCRVGIESTVIDMTGKTPTILRPGILTREEISAALGCDVDIDPSLLVRPDKFNNDSDDLKQNYGENFHPKAPGMKYKHYAPKAEMIVYEGAPVLVKEEIIKTEARAKAEGRVVRVIYYEDSGAVEAAHDFFAKLRDCDRDGVDLILASALTENGVGLAVMNRMLKSAGYNIVKVR